MTVLKRARDWNINIGTLPTGPLNKITDVKGVTVGHKTIRDGEIHTGVTSILPHQGNIFQEKVVAASHVLNGFGKTAGTIQIDELGTIETPILLTNTLSVGNVSASLIKYMLKDNPDIGRTTGTINPIVAECNDMHFNDIRQQVIHEEDVFTAIKDAKQDFPEGAVGAGTGMKCFGLKGGIGSASREIEVLNKTYTLGVLVLTNFGKLHDLIINGKNVGTKLEKMKVNDKIDNKDKGSVIIIVATDLPVSERQLERIIKRCGVGLSRTGSKMAHGSGDIVIGFSTAATIPHKRPKKLLTQTCIHEEEIDLAFHAIAEATEEAIINSMITAEKTVGRSGTTLHSLADYLSELDL
ncbi:P1 family peptidase [Evansella cellulosilytica]|uniref:Peptidase S58 DmpA n=1 Tax=Evansella cellulosilytica (strain ATCC 21833 / DSM 2522 / FERM P-1141 / JCM 9156 / N-4) TaxID=649639 RepID=E6TZQ4_EVAC2|nr:P1 family peptidase [Evansella cellulosilytica]ADU31360.1 peptidase S58 DmpA [Evansella cellulosilytica DSM 2522]